MTVIDPADYLTEATVIERWANVFRSTDLRRARRRREIAYYDFPSGIRYTAADVQAFIEMKYRRDPSPRSDMIAMPMEANQKGPAAKSKTVNATDESTPRLPEIAENDPEDDADIATFDEAMAALESGRDRRLDPGEMAARRKAPVRKPEMVSKGRSRRPKG